MLLTQEGRRHNRRAQSALPAGLLSDRAALLFAMAASRFFRCSGLSALVIEEPVNKDVPAGE